MFKKLSIITLTALILGSSMSSIVYADDMVQVSREEFDSFKIRVVQAENAARRAEEKAEAASKRADDSIGFALQAQRMANAANHRNRP